MKKNKLYVLLVLLISISLFAIAAICNQCAAMPEEETVASEKAGEEVLGAEEEVTEKEENLTNEEASEPEEEESEEISEGEEEEEETTEEEIKEAPTIELQIYEGYAEAAA